MKFGVPKVLPIFNSRHSEFRTLDIFYENTLLRYTERIHTG